MYKSGAHTVIQMSSAGAQDLPFGPSIIAMRHSTADNRGTIRDLAKELDGIHEHGILNFNIFRIALLTDVHR